MISRRLNRFRHCIRQRLTTR
ncbi:hypothetical protein [Psychrobacter sp.]